MKSSAGHYVSPASSAPKNAAAAHATTPTLQAHLCCPCRMKMPLSRKPPVEGRPHLLGAVAAHEAAAKAHGNLLQRRVRRGVVRRCAGHAVDQVLPRIAARHMQGKLRAWHTPPCICETIPRGACGPGLAPKPCKAGCLFQADEVPVRTIGFLKPARRSDSAHAV